eukprot:TRINITY_DN12713_c0_g2_i1.p2 TRINITY_DN12713_c0_g2~~TRINITY_DN12713_c0_g2_i1.p2  ORF type:complete len:119 (-),score=13.52 TRINITY_DN12713_c0_g2_i1:586-942(-)
MAKLASHVHGAETELARFFGQEIQKVREHVGRWQTEVVLVNYDDLGAKDLLAVYHDNSGTCAVSFQGTNNARKTWYDADVRPVQKCGATLHSGTWEALHVMVGSRAWTKHVVPFLSKF